MSSPALDVYGHLKPLLRGVSHQVMALVASAAATVLVMLHRESAAAVPAGVYGLSLFTMFAASALYHRTNPPQRFKRWLERADHAAIFVFIAGSYTPFCYQLPEWGMTLLAISWASAAIGVLRSLFWVDAPRWISVVQYLIAGWTIVPFVGALWRTVGPVPVVLLFAGGLLYTVGALVYARRAPNPYPSVFGFHEIFHAFVVGAAVVHFVAVAMILPQIR